MPHVAGWKEIPAGIRDHLVERMHDRRISLDDLNRLRLWMETRPEVPEGKWFKDFGSFKLCGEKSIRRRFCWLGKRLWGRSCESR